MSKLDVKLYGIDKLQSKLNNTNLSGVRRLVAENTAQMQAGAVRRAVYHGHYEGNKFVKPTGATKRSISYQITDMGMRGIVGMGTRYSPYLELGTRYMSAQPALKPAFEVQKAIFVKDLMRMLK